MSINLRMGHLKIVVTVWLFGCLAVWQFDCLNALNTRLKDNIEAGSREQFLNIFRFKPFG